MSSPLIAIIAGVGAGTGGAIARRFAQAYPVVLIARTPESYNPLVEEINGKGGKAVGISADVCDAKSMSEGLATIKKEFGEGVGAAAAIFNASGKFVRKPFLEIKEDEFIGGLDVSTRGAFLFSSNFIPLLLNGVKASTKSTSEHHLAPSPSLIFTGATASVKANALMSSFASGKFALRALSSSLAKEFGPQGIHVSHAIIDGIIDIPRTADFMKDAGPDAKISPDQIAENYWWLSCQARSTWTWEIDIRPFVEKW